MRQLEPQLLNWVGQEIYSTESAAVRRGLVASQSTFQDVALTLASQYPELEMAQELAASAILRFKGLQAEEEAYLARLARRGEDPRIQSLAMDIRLLRDRLARAHHGGEDPAEIGPSHNRAGGERTWPGQAQSPTFEQYLQVRNSSVDDLWGTLGRDTALVEFRQFSPVRFTDGTWVTHIGLPL